MKKQSLLGLGLIFFLGCTHNSGSGPATPAGPIGPGAKTGGGSSWSDQTPASQLAKEDVDFYSHVWCDSTRAFIFGKNGYVAINGAKDAFAPLEDGRSRLTWSRMANKLTINWNEGSTTYIRNLVYPNAGSSDMTPQLSLVSESQTLNFSQCDGRFISYTWQAWATEAEAPPSDSSVYPGWHVEVTKDFTADIQGNLNQAKDFNPQIGFVGGKVVPATQVSDEFAHDYDLDFNRTRMCVFVFNRAVGPLSGTSLPPQQVNFKAGEQLIVYNGGITVGGKQGSGASAMNWIYYGFKPNRFGISGMYFFIPTELVTNPEPQGNEVTDTIGSCLTGMAVVK